MSAVSTTRPEAGDAQRSHAGGEPLVEVRKLEVAFGKGPKPVRAVNGVDLTVEF